MRILAVLLPALVGCGQMQAVSSRINPSSTAGDLGGVATTPTPTPAVGDGSTSTGGGAPAVTDPTKRIVANATTCPGLIAKLNRDVDASADLQACVDSVPVGYALELPVGFVAVTKTVKITKAITVRTTGLADAAACPATEPSGCFELRARADTLIESGTGLLHVTGTGATLRNLVIDGNRAARLSSDAAAACQAGNNGLGFNLSVDGTSIRAEGLVSKNALCGTGFVVGGKALQINRNLVTSNGQHGASLWSDGITVKDAADSSFTANQVRDNSDVDFIFGGCQRCVIRDNVVAHGTAFSTAAYAAFMFHAWPDGGSSGDYTGTEVSANRVDCGAARRCGFGLYLGAESWYTAPLFGGYWHDNQVTNALTGFIVERPSGLIRIKDNLVTNSGGATLTSQGDVTTGYAYNIPFREAGVLSIEDTKIPLSAYARVTMSRKIPLDPARDVPYSQTPDTPGRPLNAGSFTLSLYRDLLKRQPTFKEVEVYTRSLSARQLDRADVLQAFRTSDEYLTTQVTKAYVQVLKRNPDTAAYATWFSYVRGGALIQQMWVEIATSPEALGRARTDGDYAAAMYRYLLGREGSAAEVATLAARLSANRAPTVASFIASPEMSTILIKDDYAWLLGRAPDESGSRTWSAFLAAGNTPAALSSAIAKTAEAQD